MLPMLHAAAAGGEMVTKQTAVWLRFIQGQVHSNLNILVNYPIHIYDENNIVHGQCWSLPWAHATRYRGGSQIIRRTFHRL